MPQKQPTAPPAAPVKLLYYAALDDWQSMIGTFSTTRSLLAEARTWLGDGENAGKSPRDAWPAGLADLVSRIDHRLSAAFARLSPCSQGHTDVGAARGIVHCYICGEQEVGANTEEACVNWERAHVARIREAIACIEEGQHA
ncbi:hypothetical protein N5J43_08185 [Pseudomonas nicosulfuronedens]|uniref:hypothetical protein n=1 Tax=Pseudomonas nicosulfuronedens TaxID=2571105 RepID=UPI00244B786D|nr:hypothetical protein [Pseudomonas nicosulfuronedens]MDH1009951.1 hypothetical protein [Pseudomonas nicosulfuronedens]MDH1978927.1 hypothetical protein [Pseudomonas nicosulfuronedens]MDH2028394.1 hypothetical protein [Pseudomonas nicosulfuronedens]